jgi:hypothetical protein
MAKTKATEENKPAFDVSQTDKRSDKRVLLDYVFALRYAPEKVDLFAPWATELDAILETEGLLPINTPVDTLVAQLSEKLDTRYVGVADEDGNVEVPGEYADYALRGNGASFFTEKATRTVKNPAQKIEDLVGKASDEQLTALAEMLKARGISL